MATGAFDLSYLLNINAVIVEFLLPLISPEDLASLELVNTECFDAVAKNDLWRTKIKSFVANRHAVRRVCRLSGLDLKAELDERPKCLRARLRAVEARLRRNLAEGALARTTFSCSADVHLDDGDSNIYYRHVASLDDGTHAFAAHGKRVDVMRIVRRAGGAGGDAWAGPGGGAALEFRHHISWGQEEAEDFEKTSVARELDLFARFVKVEGNLLFIAHFSGTITVWNWEKRAFLRRFRGHLLRKTFSSPIKAFAVGGREIAIGFVDGYVALLRFDEDRNEFHLRGYVDPLEVGGGEGLQLRALDVDAGILVVAYADQILTVGVESMAVERRIWWNSDSLVELSFNARKKEILIGNIFGDEFFLLDSKSGKVLRRFSLPENEMMTSIATDWDDHVAAGSWEASIFVWEKEADSKPLKVYKSEERAKLNISQQTYRASGIDHLNFDGIHLTFTETHGTNVTLLDVGRDAFL